MGGRDRSREIEGKGKVGELGGFDLDRVRKAEKTGRGDII